MDVDLVWYFLMVVWLARHSFEYARFIDITLESRCVGFWFLGGIAAANAVHGELKSEDRGSA